MLVEKFSYYLLYCIISITLYYTNYLLFYSTDNLLASNFHKSECEFFTTIFLNSNLKTK